MDSLQQAVKVKTWEVYHSSWNVFKAWSFADAREVKMFLERVPSVDGNKFTIQRGFAYLTKAEITKLRYFLAPSGRRLQIAHKVKR